MFRPDDLKEYIIEVCQELQNGIPNDVSDIEAKTYTELKDYVVKLGSFIHDAVDELGEVYAMCEHSRSRMN